MKKKTFNILLSVAAYSFLIYKLVSYGNYAELISIFSNAQADRYVCLISAIILFPLNIFLESVKWRYLSGNIKYISINEAQRQVYYGYLGAFLTPARVGEYPSRALFYDKKNILTLTALGYIGSAALMLVMIVFGLIALPVYLSHSDAIKITYFLPYCLLVILLLLVVVLSFPRIFDKLYIKYNKDIFKCLASFKKSNFLIVLWYSFLRYALYVVQFILVLYFCNIGLSYSEILVSVALYYMLVTLTPSFALADAAIRGSWAVVVFTAFSEQAALSAAIAAVIIWVINTVFPMIVGSVVSSKLK